MVNVMLRPDLKTSGGEVNDILLHGRYVGTMTLVYRDGDRLSGSIQLEEESLSDKEQADVVSFAKQYVQFMIDAVRAAECDVVVTCSPYEDVIATSGNVGVIREFVGSGSEAFQDDLEYDVVETDTRLEDFDSGERDLIEMDQPKSRNRKRKPPVQATSPQRERESEAAYYELVIVGESRNKVEYHLYGRNQKWLAEAFMKFYGGDVVGDVDWKIRPTEEGIEHAAELLVSDFDESQVDSFHINMRHNGKVLETIELTHQDLADEDEDEAYHVQGEYAADAEEEEEYSVVLARDDQDTLTYEIYQQSYGGLPIGTATVDISRRQLTGFVDFREPGSREDRELIATLLMNELDKEKDYESFSLTMLYNNEPIDELQFTNEPVH